MGAREVFADVGRDAFVSGDLARGVWTEPIDFALERNCLDVFASISEDVNGIEVVAVECDADVVASVGWMAGLAVFVVVAIRFAAEVEFDDAFFSERDALVFVEQDRGEGIGQLRCATTSFQAILEFFVG